MNLLESDLARPCQHSQKESQSILTLILIEFPDNELPIRKLLLKINYAQAMVCKADFVVWKYRRKGPSRRQPLIERPHRPIGTTGTACGACKNELAFKTEERSFERYLPLIKGSVGLYAR